MRERTKTTTILGTTIPPAEIAGNRRNPRRTKGGEASREESRGEGGVESERTRQVLRMNMYGGDAAHHIITKCRFKIGLHSRLLA